MYHAPVFNWGNFRRENMHAEEYSQRAALTNKENSVILHLKKADKDCNFGSAEVYVRTSDRSGEIYLKYNLVYEKNPVETTWKDKDGKTVPLTWYNGANGGFNRSNYRVRTATICRKNGDVFEKMYDVLQQGEISMAFKEKQTASGTGAGDYVGGFHGDENIKFDGENAMVQISIDGQKLSLEGKEDKIYVGNVVKFEQTTLINRCNTPLVNIVEHNQKIRFDIEGMHVEQNAEFLTSDYEEGGAYELDNGGSYMQMCTFWRLNNDRRDERICDELRFYDENCRIINNADTSSYKYGDFGWAGAETEKNNRAVEYVGNKGIYGLVGYEIVDNSVACQSSKIMIRTFGDNKWYSSFKSLNPNHQPKCGEKWSLKLLYYIDYNSER